MDFVPDAAAAQRPLQFVPDAAPAPEAANQPAYAPREASGVWDSMVAGYQQSATGLALRGKLPDVVLSPQHSKWYERAMSGATSTVADLPEEITGMAAGTALGTLTSPVTGPVGPVVGAGAGFMAVPAAIRESLIQAYTKGEVKSSADFLARTSIVAQQTGKAALIGGVTGGAGMAASRIAGSAIAPMIGTEIGVGTGTKLIGTAEGAGMIAGQAVTPAALEGRLPEAQDFADAAIVVGGMKLAGAIAPRLAQIYARTGVEPSQVAADAAREPGLRAELREPAIEGGDIPNAYKPVAAASAAHEIIPEPGSDPTHDLNIAAMISEPYGEIPKSKLPNYENFRYVQGPEDMQAVSARASQVFEDQIQKARGSQTWDQTKQQAIEFLAKRAQDKGETFNMPATDDQVVQLASKGMAAESMQQAAAQAVADAARVAAKEASENGGKVSDATARAQVSAIEMVRAWTALDQGNAAEIARALNARKAAGQMRALSQGILAGVGKYGDDAAAMAQYILNLGDAQKIAKFANQIDPATTLDKLQHYYRFALLTGATVFQVKAVGDMLGTMERIANVTLRPLTSVVGSGEFSERMSEASAVYGSLFQGAKDGMKATIETWKATAVPKAVFGEPGKPNAADYVTAIPHRIIETETAFFRALNERMEMNRMATQTAMGENFRPGTPDFDQRITTLLQSPTKEMQASSEQAGAEATFTNKTSGLGKLLQDVSNNKYGKWGGFVVPFAKVPVNLAAWSIKDTPALGLLMEGNRAAWKEGGAAKDAVLARQIIGGTVAALAAGAVAQGNLTGGGQSITPEQRAARRASNVPDYSVKVGSTWYSYERFQPLGTIMMLASDLMEMHQQADQAYKADLVKMTGAVMGHAIVSQPYFEGMHSAMDVLTSPEKGAKVYDSMIGSWIPSGLAQAASTIDPEKRRVDGLMDTIQSRIPFWREQLLPQINPLTGEPVPKARGLGLVSTVEASKDKVLNEAARLQIGISPTPKNLELPSMKQKDVGKVELTPEQQNIFTKARGEIIHNAMTRMVDSPEWAGLPDISQKQLFSKAIELGGKIGRAEAMTPQQRSTEAARIHEALLLKLQGKEAQ